MSNESNRKQNTRGQSSLKKAAKTTGSVSLRIILICLIVIGCFLVGTVAYKFGYEMFSDTAMEEAPGRDVLIVVTDNMTDSQLAKLLVKKGLTENETATKLLISIFTSSSYDISPGEYTLNTSMTPREIIDAMCSVITEEATTSDHLGLYD